MFQILYKLLHSVIDQIMHHLITAVVYFDQRKHACACVRMVENVQKHLKMSKKVPFSSCARDAHVRLTKKNEEKQKKLFTSFHLLFAWLLFYAVAKHMRINQYLHKVD